MDDTLLATAYLRFSDSHDCFLEGILCDPELREEFLIDVHGKAPDAAEVEVLSRLVHLRKRGQLARKKPR